MASMSIQEMRLIVANAYPGKGWHYRVMHLMKENQVIAIYQSILNRDTEKVKKEMEARKEGHWEQMSFFDALGIPKGGE